jgi:hypothetical protein
MLSQDNSVSNMTDYRLGGQDLVLGRVKYFSFPVGGRINSLEHGADHSHLLVPMSQMHGTYPS